MQYDKPLVCDSIRSTQTGPKTYSLQPIRHMSSRTKILLCEGGGAKFFLLPWRRMIHCITYCYHHSAFFLIIIIILLIYNHHHHHHHHHFMNVKSSCSSSSSFYYIIY